MGSTHGRTSSNVACHHRLLAAHTVERRRTWHTVIAIGKHTRSTDVGRGMPSSPLGSTDGRTTSSVACHYRPWVAHTVERRRTWHTVIAVGKHTRSNDVGRGMPSSPLVSINGQTTLGVACHHRLWAAHTVKRRRACRAIIVFGQHIRLIDVGRGMPSSPLRSTHGRATSWWHAIIALGQHRQSSGVRRGMPSSPFGSIHGRTA